MHLADVGDVARLEADRIGRFPAVGIAGGIVDLHFVEAGLKGLDLVKAFEDRAVFESRH